MVTIKPITVYKSELAEVGVFYSNNESKPIIAFGLEGARCTVQTKGQKRNKIFTVWMNTLSDVIDAKDMPDEALYSHELGILAKDKEEFDLSIATLNKDLSKAKQISVKY